MKLNPIKILYKSLEGWTDPIWGCRATWIWSFSRFLPWPLSKLPISRKLSANLVGRAYSDYCFVPYDDPDFLGFKCWNAHPCPVEWTKITQKQKGLIVHIKPQKFLGNQWGRWIKSKELET